MLRIVTLAVTDPVGAKRLLVRRRLYEWSVILIMVSASEQTTYVLVLSLDVASISEVRSTRGRLTNNNDPSESRSRNRNRSRIVESTEENFLDGRTDLGTDVLIAKNLEEKGLEFIHFILSDSARTRRSAIDNPRISTRNSNPAAGHALSVTRSQGARYTTDRQGQRKFIDRKEWSQGPIGTRAEERRTILATHDGNRKAFALIRGTQITICVDE